MGDERKPEVKSVMVPPPDPDEVRRLQKAMWEGTEALLSRAEAAERERDELRRIGDQLQSAASRMAASFDTNELTPMSGWKYELRMAVLEAESAVADWTCARAALGATREEQT